MRWGADLAVRYLLRPAPDTPPAPTPAEDDPNYLSTEAARRLAAGPTSASSCASSATSTSGPRPIEDTAVEWTERVAPPEPVAVLTHPAAATSASRRRAGAGPGRSTRWPSTRGTPPTSSARSATSTGPARRSTTPARRTGRATAGRPRSPLRNEVARRAARAGLLGASTASSSGTGCRCALGLLNLEVVPARAAQAEPASTPSCARRRRRARPVPPAAPAEESRCRAHVRRHATTTSPHPTMGAVGAAFGRNLTPGLPPETCSTSRTRSPSASSCSTASSSSRPRSLNLLAAAWIQFQVHDWVEPRRATRSARTT